MIVLLLFLVSPLASVRKGYHFKTLSADVGNIFITLRVTL